MDLRETYRKLRKTYDRIASDWHVDHLHDDWWVEGTRAFIAQLEPGQTVLDVGCGTGLKTSFLTDAGLDVAGIDFSVEMIRIAKREYPHIPFRVHDMRYASDLKVIFNAVFSQASLLHVPKLDIPYVLADWRRVLAPRGLLYVAVKGTWEGRPEEEVRVEDDYGYPYERFFSYFEPQELEEAFANAGFTTIRLIAPEVVPGRTGWIQVIGRLP